MGYYKSYNLGVQEFIDKGCPVAIGDNVEIHFYESESRCFLGKVTDIKVHTKRDLLNDLLNESGFNELVEQNIVTINEDVLNVPIMKFDVTVEYTYYDTETKRILFKDKTFVKNEHTEIRTFRINPDGRESWHTYIIKK